MRSANTANDHNPPFMPKTFATVAKTERPQRTAGRFAQRTLLHRAEKGEKALPSSLPKYGTPKIRDPQCQFNTISNSVKLSACQTRGTMG